MGKRSKSARATGWLIRPEWLDRIKAAMLPGADALDTDEPQGFEALSTDGGVAVVNITGVISRYSDSWSWLFGGTSVDEIDTALTSALEDPAVRGIVLRVNSPGGEASGIAEIARKIRAASSVKPVVAYVDGDAASAAYWMASAAKSIVINEIGWAGSIGAYMLFYDQKKAMSDLGVKEIHIVSSQSPNKVPDPSTEEGASQYQAQVDALAQVFIDSVARYRSVSPETVIEKFGAGDVFIGAEAVARGLADRVGVFETALDLIGQEITNVQGGTRAMTVEEIRVQFPDAASALLAEGAAAERARILAVQQLGVADEDKEIIEAAINGGTSAAETALKILAAQKSRKDKLKADRAADAEALNAAAGAGAPAVQKTDAELAEEEGKKIAAAAPRDHKEVKHV